jgi:hypothetical protein
MEKQRRVFVLRCWQEEQPGASGAQWRFALTETGEASPRGFADLVALVRYLREQFAQSESGSGAEGEL